MPQHRARVRLAARRVSSRLVVFNAIKRVSRAAEIKPDGLIFITRTEDGRTPPKRAIIKTNRFPPIPDDDDINGAGPNHNC